MAYKDKAKKSAYNATYSAAHKKDRSAYNAKYHKAHGEANRLRWLNYIGRVACESCGYDRCFAAIDAHHRDPGLKAYLIAPFLNRAFNAKNRARYDAEIKKCTWLCRNCHAELHANERNEVKNGQHDCCAQGVTSD